MSLACVKKLIIATAGVAAPLWLAAGCAEIPTWQKTPAFARIAVSEKSIVYVQILNGELRAAMSVDGLQTATPVRVRSTMPNAAFSSEFALPVPADQLPAGVTAIKASLGVQQALRSAAAEPSPYVFGTLTVYRTDYQKATWQYEWSVTQGIGSDGKAVDAPFTLLNLDNLKLSLNVTPSKGKLAIVLRILADGRHFLSDVRKDGQPVEAKVVVTDASGVEAASKVGRLSVFGFS